MSVLSINNISKSFGTTDVLHDISFDVAEGEAVSVIGPSGSGKSTLLRIIALLEKGTTGSVSYGEHCSISYLGNKPVISDKADIKKIKGYFGLVFQNFNLFPHVTVLQNIIDAPVHVYGRNKKEVTDEAMALLEKFGLGDRANFYPSQLSGGQQQRVSIARALALHPKIMLFDEPTSALDPELTVGILKVLRELAEENMTMVIVTHEISFARNVSDRVIFMDGGYIVEQGAPADVIDNPQNQRTRDFLAGFNA